MVKTIDILLTNIQRKKIKNNHWLDFTFFRQFRPIALCPFILILTLYINLVIVHVALIQFDKDCLIHDLYRGHGILNCFFFIYLLASYPFNLERKNYIYSQ